MSGLAQRIRGMGGHTARQDLDWSAIAECGDVGATPPGLTLGSAIAEPRVRRRTSRLTLIILIGWLAWEGAGLVRALTIGPPILEATWEARP